MFIFNSKRTLSFRCWRLDGTAATVVMSSEGGKPQSFTQAAPNELKLGKEGQRGESWPSAWRWRRGVSRGQERRTKDQAGPS